MCKIVIFCIFAGIVIQLLLLTQERFEKILEVLNSFKNRTNPKYVCGDDVANLTNN